MSESATQNSAAQLSEEELLQWLKERIAEHVEMSADGIGADVPFASYGLDSVYAFAVIAEIEDRLGLTLEPTVMWDHPTLGSLVTVIAEALRSKG
ncbi:acyl carrier protein [Streptomyces sp. NPDC056638]|uniref:acyl carrier protein n=1 Tax=Streptomyces sp. NPDC056638 TaxID=3345887 RepID=UPI0036899FE9